MNLINEYISNNSIVGASLSVLIILCVTYFVVSKSFNFSKQSKTPDVMVAIASGIMITILFLHLLREVYETNKEGPISVVIISLFIFFVLSLINHSHSHSHGKDIQEENSLMDDIKHHGSRFAVLAGQGVHSLADGIVIISGWIASPLTGLLTSSAIALHHVPMMMGISNKYKDIYTKRFITIYIVYTSLAMLLGIYFAKVIYTLVAKEYFIAIAAASFAHIAILDMFGHVRESHHISKGSKVLFILLGIALAYMSEMSHLH